MRLRQGARGGARWGPRLCLFPGLRGCESCRFVPCPAPPALSCGVPSRHSYPFSPKVPKFSCLPGTRLSDFHTEKPFYDLFDDPVAERTFSRCLQTPGVFTKPTNRTPTLTNPDVAFMSFGMIFPVLRGMQASELKDRYLLL